MIQLTLTLKMTTPQVVETSVTVNNNSPIQNYVHPDDQSIVVYIVHVLSSSELVEPHIIPFKVRLAVALKRGSSMTGICERL